MLCAARVPLPIVLQYLADRPVPIFIAMKLDLRFVEVSLEDLWCEAVAGLVSEEPLDLQGPIFPLDAKTGGYLTFLRETGFWKGSLGSTILVASEGRIKADKILLKGLGPKADCFSEAFMRCVAELGDSLAKLKIHDLAVWIPLPQNQEEDPATPFRNACSTFLKSYEKKCGRDSDFFLKAVFLVPHTFLAYLGDMVGRLKDEFGYMDFCSIVTMGKGH